MCQHFGYQRISWAALELFSVVMSCCHAALSPSTTAALSAPDTQCLSVVMEHLQWTLTFEHSKLNSRKLSSACPFPAWQASVQQKEIQSGDAALVCDRLTAFTCSSTSTEGVTRSGFWSKGDLLWDSSWTAGVECEEDADDRDYESDDSDEDSDSESEASFEEEISPEELQELCNEEGPTDLGIA